MISFLRPVASTALRELDVLPGIDRRTIIGGELAEDLPQRCDRWLVLAGLDVDRGVHDRQAIRHRDLRRAHDIADQPLALHRCDRVHLHRLVVDDDEGAILRGQKLIFDRITNGFARH
jgi:hypothetical protein